MSRCTEQVVGNLEIQKPKHLKIWEPVNPEMLDPETYKISKPKSVLPKISARSGVVGEKTILAQFGVISDMFYHGPNKTEI